MRIFQQEPLRKEVEKEIEELGARLGFEDGDMQRKMLQDMELFLMTHQKEQENLNRERDRLTLCAGVK